MIRSSSFMSISKDDIPSIWVDKINLIKVLIWLKNEVSLPFKMLYDLTALMNEHVNTVAVSLLPTSL